MCNLSNIIPFYKMTIQSQGCPCLVYVFFFWATRLSFFILSNSFVSNIIPFYTSLQQYPVAGLSSVSVITFMSVFTLVLYVTRLAPLFSLMDRSYPKRNQYLSCMKTKRRAVLNHIIQTAEHLDVRTPNQILLWHI